MGLSMCALIAFQLWWINSSFKANKERLDMDVNAFMSNVSTQLFLRNLLYNQNVSVFDVLPTGNDHVTMKIRKNDSPIARDSFKVQVAIPGFRMKQLKKENQPGMSSAMSVGDIASAIKRTYYSNDSSFETAKIRTIDSTIKSGLKKAGITTPYVYGVIQNRSGKVKYISDKLANINELKKGYHVRLDVGSKVDAEDVYLYFPKLDRYIYAKIWFIFVASLLLIIIILSCFWYSIRIIFRQKKISDIRSDFINNMTHEFKTPISTVSLATEALLSFDVRKSEEKTVQYLKIAQQENKRLGNMVEKVLNIAAYDRGEIRLQFQQTDMNELIETAISNMQMQILERNAVLTRYYNADNYNLDVDQDHFKNVITTLIDNALKYSEGQPGIEIHTSNSKDFFVISVEDHGIGISKEEQKKIFEKFYRVPTGKVHNVKGFGLGLSYAAGIVKMHGGSISVQSQLNRGSIFEIHIPLKHES